MFPRFVPAPVLAAALLVAASSAQAQITTNQGALDALGSGHAARTSAKHAPAHPHPKPHPSKAAPKPAAKSAARKSDAAPSRPAPSPTIPATPPAAPVLAPPVVQVPTHAPPPPPPVPVVQSAQGTAAALPGGTRIGFGPDSSDLNPATMQALQDFATGLKADPQARAEVDAYGSGPADDPSTPRRMALSRGLNVRAVLINAGIPTTRIYVRAVGLPHDGGSADRVDLVRSDAANGTPAPAAATSASPTPAATPGGSR
jgi:outer membrane protein OmpA-like peptidoglycan-associated protein